MNRLGITPKRLSSIQHKKGLQLYNSNVIQAIPKGIAYFWPNDYLRFKIRVVGDLFMYIRILKKECSKQFLVQNHL